MPELLRGRAEKASVRYSFANLDRVCWSDRLQPEATLAAHMLCPRAGLMQCVDAHPQPFGQQPTTSPGQ